MTGWASWLEGRRSLALVAAAALAIRLAYALANPPPPLTGDAAEYHDFAVHLLDQGRYEDSAGNRAVRTPGYPMFLAGTYALFGRSGAAVSGAQTLLGSLACVLVALSARGFLAGAWPALCGLAAALYFGLYSTPALRISESLYSFSLALSFALFYGPGRPAARAVLFGLVMAAAYLVRPEALFLAAAAFALMPFIPEYGWRRAALAAAAFGLAVSVWVGRNYAVFGRLVPASTRGAFSLYCGLQFPLERNGLTQEPFYHPPEGLGELEADAEYRREFQALKGRLSAWRLIQAYAFNLFTHFYPFLPAYDVSFVLLLPFWLYGLRLSLRRRELWPMSAGILISIVLYTAFGGPASRYRQGYSPLMVLLAGAGAEDLLRKPGSRLYVRLWAGFNAAVWLFAGSIRDLALWMKAAFFR